MSNEEKVMQKEIVELAGKLADYAAREYGPDPATGHHRRVMMLLFEGENAILKNREIMGATNPAQAAEGTIRKQFALSIGENSVHGSDAPETAAQEIAYWFSATEIVG